MNQRTSSIQNPVNHWLIFMLVIILLSSILSFAPVRQARAEQALAVEPTTTNECSNLDVIFLVDQSQSMGGLPLPDNPAAAQLGNDPTLQRKYAVEGMIDMLVDLTLGQCPDSYHRIGVISFGDEAAVDLPLSIIAPADSNEAIRLRDQLKGNVQAVNLGKTNTWDAFLEAKQMFDDAGSTPAGTEQRKRVIILITDGFPCRDFTCQDYQTNTGSLRTQLAQQFPFSADLQARENCMAELRQQYADDENGIPPEEINTCLADHVVATDSYDNSTYVWTVLLKSDAAYPSGVLENLDDMSNAHAGSMIQLSHNRGDIPAAMREILSQLAGVRPNVLDCGKSFAVNPYLRRMVVNAYGIDNTTQITMTYKDANGTSHSVTGGVDSSAAIIVSEYYTYGTNERYVIEYPFPGLWELTSSQNCNGLDVYYDPVQIDPTHYTANLPDQIPQYDRSPYYDIDRPYYLEYQLFQRGESDPVAQADAVIFAINVQLSVTDPNGENTVSYPMSYIQGEKIYRSTKPLEVEIPGEYTIHIKGTSLMHEGEPVVDTTNPLIVFTTEYTVFENEDVKFTVFPVQPFLINVVSPQAGSTSRSVHASIFKGWPLKLETFPARVRISDRQGNTLTNLETVFINQSLAFQATLSAGSISSAPVALLPDPNIPGEFVADIPGVDVVGPQILTITLLDTAIHEQYVPDDRKVEVNFTRADYLWTTPIFYKSLAGFLLAFVFCLIGFNIAIRTNKVSGTLRFEDGGVPIAEFGLYNGTNTKKIGPRELSSTPTLFLKKISVQNTGKKRKAKGTESDGVTDSLYPEIAEAQGIRVTLTTSGGRKFTMDLMPQLPTGYGDETFAQMVYEPIESTSSNS